MKFGVLVFPGSNCDHDMVYVLRDKMGHEVVELWHKDTDLQGVDGIAIPGGFSYGDYLRSGALARFSPVMEKVIEFANNGGLVFGVCNGFQILCEADLLPGTLLHNDNQDKALKIPIAHGEGRYFADDETLKEMRLNKQILFRYCNENGDVNSHTNPNGSIENIAGVCNAKKNVFGMMPHPERAADEELGNEDGKLILESLIKSFIA